MVQILHQRATTMHVIRAEIQRSAASIATLSSRYGTTTPKPFATCASSRRSSMTEWGQRHRSHPL